MGAPAVAADDPLAHLLRRLAFVVRPADVAAARSLPREAIIEAALAGKPYPGHDQGVTAGVVDPSGAPFYVVAPKGGSPVHGVISAAEAEAAVALRFAARDSAAAGTKVGQQVLQRYRLDDAVLADTFSGAPMAGGVATSAPDTAATAAAQKLLGSHAAIFDPATDLSAAQMWWTDRMLRTAWPLQELMVLFWHNHFATANYKVNSPALMIRQNQLFRRHALGNFGELMQAVAVDPAMLIWLDGTTSHKKAPNENFGREFMELFTLGLGYTQADVEAAARALTGWHYNRQTDRVTFNPKDHDDGPKTFFGQTGNWNGADVIRIALAQPAHGPFLMGKLWNFFVGTTPSSAALGAVVDAYRQGGLKISTALRAIFSSPAFHAPDAMWALYRNPAEYVVGAMRALARPVMDPSPVASMSALGQALFDPPNVGGWPHGAAWINPGTLLGRFNFAERLAQSEPRPPLQSLAGQLAGGQEAAVVDALMARAGLHGVSAATRQALVGYAGAPRWTARTAFGKLGGLIHLVLSAPEFLMK